MKKFLLLVVFIGLFLPFKAAAWKSLNYSRPGNWGICEEKIRENCEVDLFYVLPTIYSDKDNAYMLWHNNPALQKKAQMIAVQHTGIFSPYCRVFAPYYRQAEFRRALKEINLPIEKQTFIMHGVNDVIAAFRYYMKHHNKGLYSVWIQSGFGGSARSNEERICREKRQCKTGGGVSYRLSQYAENFPQTSLFAHRSESR